MEQLRTYFDRALDSEPAPPAPLDDLARAAMVNGSRLRRRRQIGYAATTTVAAVALVAVGVLLPVRDVPVPVPAQAAMPSATPVLCRGVSTDGAATGASVFLGEPVTDEQRSAIEAALRDDPRLLTVRYESKQYAYERFLELYRDPPPEVVFTEPDLLDRVSVNQMPERFRITLADPATYPQISASLLMMTGVVEVIGEFCPRGASPQVDE